MSYKNTEDFVHIIDVYYQRRFSPREYDRWVEMEANKLAAWKDELPSGKNHGVFPGKTLPDVLVEAEERFAHMTDADMHEKHMATGSPRATEGLPGPPTRR